MVTKSPRLKSMFESPDHRNRICKDGELRPAFTARRGADFA